jgi:hypothetical protein
MASQLGPFRGTFPDFILGGAMKCGTSSLHSVLAHHPAIFIPDEEVHFFCMDDFVQHPDFLRYAPTRVQFETNQAEKATWYSSFFEPAAPDQLVGEDSTVYLPSPVAPERIRTYLPDVKLLFMLRNPVDRTYSQYWHHVRTGRAVHRFPDELRYGSTSFHLRSFYKPQLERYLETFPREQIKVVLFERFVERPQAVVDEVCSFLGVSGSVDVSEVPSHVRASRSPRFLRLYLLLNYARRGLLNRYDAHLPPTRGTTTNEAALGTRMLRSFYRRLQTLIPEAESYPPMDAEVRDRLAHFYARKNRGLDQLLAVDLSSYWSLP